MKRGPLEGWSLTGWIGLGLAAMVATVLVAAGTDEPGVRMAIRATARSSVVLFALAFGASSLRRLWRHDFTAWLLRNRRQVGVAFAASHFIHLAAILEAAIRFPEFRAGVEWLTIVFGGLAYVFLAAMTVTSFDRTAAWLGRRRWRQLHLAGSWYVWFIFFQSYLPRAVFDPTAISVAATGLVLSIPAVRIAARRRAGASARLATPA